MTPRRTGILEEYQHGHYFMYIVTWEEQTKPDGTTPARVHREIEIYFAKAREVWNSTDPEKFEQAKKLFFENPSAFEGHPDGELP